MTTSPENSENSENTEEPRSTLRNPQEVYDLVWKETVETDGELDREKVVTTLYSFGALIQNISAVYGYITEGQIVDAFSDPREVVEISDQFVVDTLDDGVGAVISSIVNVGNEIKRKTDRLAFYERVFDRILTGTAVRDAINESLSERDTD